MSHNVQKYDRQVYLRVSEAQRCRVHSTLVMPVFDVSRGDGSGTLDLAAAQAAAAGSGALRPVAVFELVQADRDVAFPEVIAQLRKCLLVSVCSPRWGGGGRARGGVAHGGGGGDASCREFMGDRDAPLLK
jgi:hypothetical protein